MSKVYFDRKMPFFLSRDPSFYATPVDVPEPAVRSIYALRALLKEMDKQIAASASPEVANQELADYFVSEVAKIFKTRKQDNTRANRRGKEQS